MASRMIPAAAISGVSPAVLASSTEAPPACRSASSDVVSPVRAAWKSGAVQSETLGAVGMTDPDVAAVGSSGVSAIGSPNEQTQNDMGGDAREASR